MKKGTSISVLAIAVIIIVLLLVFIFFLAKTKMTALKILDDTECKASITSHNILMKTTGEAVVTDIYCPTKYYTIPKSSDTEIKHYLAESMKTCWSTWGAGELRLFEGDGFFCHICSVVDFKEKDKTVSGFDYYLTATPYKEGTSLSYFDYLIGFRSEKAPEILKDKMIETDYLDTIDTSQSYATIFLYVKGEKNIKSFLDKMSPALGTPGGGVVTGLVLGTAGSIVLSVVTGGGFPLVFIGTAIFTGIGGIVGVAASDEVAWIANIGLIPYNAQSMSEIGCEITPVRQEKKDAIT